MSISNVPYCNTTLVDVVELTTQAELAGRYSFKVSLAVGKSVAGSIKDIVSYGAYLATDI